jgi:3-deoxy-7-phosphoheptulonate synthase
MIITLDRDASEDEVKNILEVIARHKEVKQRKYDYRGASQTVTEIHLIGPPEVMQTIPEKLFADLPGVRSVVRVSTRYRLIGRHGKQEVPGFEYNGVRFDESKVHIFAGLCAVDSRENVAKTMAALKSNGITTARMGAYKPRTSPYDFQGLGGECLPWTFELAGTYGIKIVAMEVTNARHLEEVQKALDESGTATGVMLQVGTRNAQNFELLKQLGQQRTFPVLFKRGMGITLEESLNACEYIASEGNPRIVFCLRGMKTHLGDPHRNLVDFAHVPVVRRQTRLPVCVDPSHSVGRLDRAPDGLLDIFHVVGQGIIAGASMVLVDFHPDPKTALCDGAQALRLEQLPHLVEYVSRVRSAYDRVCELGRSGI